MARGLLRGLVVLCFAGCGPVLDGTAQLFPARRDDPEPEHLVAFEIAHLPYDRIVWQHRLDIPGVERITEGTEHLYVESADRRLFAVDKAGGTVVWIYNTARREPFRFPPVEAQGVAASRAELEARLRGVTRQIEELSDRSRLDYGALEQLRRQRAQLAEALRSEEQGDHVYLVTHTDLIALDRRSGREMWRTRLRFVPAAAPAATRGHVYLPAGDWSRIYVLSVESRGQEASFFRPMLGGPENAIGATPIVWGDLLLAVAYDGVVYGFDRRSGEVVWSHATPGILNVTPAVLSVRGAAAPLLVVPGNDRAVYAFDMATQTLRWRHELDGVCREPPRGDGELVYVPVAGDGLIALEATADRIGGRLRWRFPGGERYLAPTARGILVEGPPGWLSELRKEDGRILAQYPKGLVRIFVASRDGERIFAATPMGRLYALERTQSGLPPDSVRSWR